MSPSERAAVDQAHRQFGEPTATSKPRAGEHVPGPWYSDQDGFIYTERDDEDQIVIAKAHEHPRANATLMNARRIVACVNACEGIKTENLEHASLDFGKELRADLDEALDALTLLDQAENGPWDGEEQKRHLRTAWSVARAALAKHGR